MLLGPGQDIEPADIVQHQVGYDDMVFTAFQHPQSFQPRRSGIDRIPLLFEQVGKKYPEETVIFNDEDFPHACNSLGAGTETRELFV
jgi:hypothetical protein